MIINNIDKYYGYNRKSDKIICKLILDNHLCKPLQDD